MVGISQQYDQEAAELETGIRRRTSDLFVVHVLRSIDRLPEGESWDDSRFIVRARRDDLGYTMEVSRLMIEHSRIDGPLMVARTINDHFNAYEREHSAPTAAPSSPAPD